MLNYKDGDINRFKKKRNYNSNAKLYDVDQDAKTPSKIRVLSEGFVITCTCSR